jgi:hypothetical protein
MVVRGNGLGNELEGIFSVVTKSVEAAAMRALLEQCRMDVSWWRGGLRAIGLPPPPPPALPGGVSGSTPPLMISRALLLATLFVIKDNAGNINI